MKRTPYPILLMVCIAVLFAGTARLGATDVPRKAFHGAITAIGTASITVHGSDDDQRVFQIASDTSVVAAGNPNATAADLKVGDKVAVSYTEEGTTLVAHRIEASSSGDSP